MPRDYPLLPVGQEGRLAAAAGRGQREERPAAPLIAKVRKAKPQLHAPSKAAEDEKGVDLDMGPERLDGQFEAMDTPT